MKIVLSGTDSPGFLFAEDESYTTIVFNVILPLFPTVNLNPYWKFMGLTNISVTAAS